MAQTDLKSDAFCSYNQAAAGLDWTLEKGQYYNTFAYGTVGVSAASNYVRPDIVNIDSYLSGRDDILSKCNPPIPALEDANPAPMTYQHNNTNLLQPIYTREPRAAINLSAISYIPLTFEFLPSDPQNIDHIVFSGWSQRGGADTENITKNAWNNPSCEYFLDPQRACGQKCSEVNGYMVRKPPTANRPEAEWGTLPRGLPNPSWYSNPQHNTQIGKAFGPTQLTSQMVVDMGAGRCGPQYVVPKEAAAKYPTKGACPTAKAFGQPYAAPPRQASPNTGKLL